MADTEVFKAPSLPVDTTKVEEKEEKTEDAAPPLAPPPPKKPPVAPTLDYSPPSFALPPDDSLGYKLEVLKEGSIVDTIDLSRRKNPSFVTIGRLPECDVILEHPSISRFHCILQYGDDRMGKSRPGWFIFDLGSTHGSKMNKNKLPPKQYLRVNVGFVLQFGASSRLFNLLGPSEDAEPEWELSPTEMREKIARKKLEAKLAKEAKEELEKEKERERQEEGIDWGMNYEDPGPSGLVVSAESDAFLMEDHEAFYRENPLKALTKFFDREGFDMEFVYTESGVGGHNHKWICSIELPIEVGAQRTVTASATVSTAKKDAQVHCALEACRILDQHNILRRSTAVLREKRNTLAENDYYDDDEDIFFDRTGQIEEQREKRMARMEALTKKAPAIDSYETLCVKLEAKKKECDEVQRQLERLRQATTDTNVSDVDEYVRKMEETGTTDFQSKAAKSVMTQKYVKLKQECQKLEKLVKIAQPVALPDLKKDAKGGIMISVGGTNQQNLLRKMLQMRKEKREEPEKGESKDEESAPTENGFVPEDDEEEGLPSGLKTKGPQMPAREKKVEESGMDEKKKEEEMEVEKEVEKTKVKDEPRKEEPVEAKIEDVKLIPEVEVKEQKKKPEVEAAEDGKKELPAWKVAAKRALDEQDDEPPATSEPSKRQRVRRRDEEGRKPAHRPPKDVDLSGDYGKGIEGSDETYATWMPPSDQRGDGTTKLNEKFAGRY